MRATSKTFLFKSFSVFRTKTVRRLFSRMKIDGRRRKPHIIARQNATDGGDIQKLWMNKGGSGNHGFRGGLAARITSGGDILGRSKSHSAGEIRGPSESAFILYYFKTTSALIPP